LIIPLMIMAFGLGFGMAQRTNIIASVVDPHEIGVASSVLALVRNIAGAFGIAVFGTMLNDVTNSKVLEIAQHSVIHSTNPAVIQQGVGLIILKAQVAAYSVVFYYAAMIVLIGAGVALFLKVQHVRTDIEVRVE